MAGTFKELINGVLQSKIADPATTLGTLISGIVQTWTGTHTFTALTVFNAPVRLKGYTVAGLPAGTVGDTAYVTNALAPAFGVAVVGGGAVVCPVFYDGAAWIVR